MKPKQARQILNLRQKDVSEHLWVSRHRISRIERGICDMNAVEEAYYDDLIDEAVGGVIDDQRFSMWDGLKSLFNIK